MRDTFLSVHLFYPQEIQFGNKSYMLRSSADFDKLPADCQPARDLPAGNLISGRGPPVGLYVDLVDSEYSLN